MTPSIQSPAFDTSSWQTPAAAAAGAVGKSLFAVNHSGPSRRGKSAAGGIGTAEHNADAENTLTLSAGSYSLDSNLGKLLIENASALSHKTLTITGAGPSDATIVPGDAATWRDRILQIVGSDVSVIFQHLTIAGGVAMDGGGVGGFTAVGGGLLIVGAGHAERCASVQQYGRRR